ncbi:unnamed protein product, partial [marine sediment metagenome]
MPEKRRISPAIILAAGTGIAVAAVAGIYALARAAPPEEEAPPEVYTCPLCGAEFASEQELINHLDREHPARPRIVSATWKATYNQYGGFYGQLVKAVITVDSPVAFTGELKVSLPGEIAGAGLINHDQMLQKALTTVAQVDPEGEFYIGTSYSTALKALVYGHYSKMDAVRDSCSHTVDFPEGVSTFDVAFFLRPDYFRYSYSRGELKWVDKPYYLPTLHSPKVELYDEADNLLDSAEYRYAIEVKSA